MEQVILFQSLTLGNLVYGASQNSLHFPPFLAYSEQGLLFPNCYCEDDLTVGGGGGWVLALPKTLSALGLAPYTEFVLQVLERRLTCFHSGNFNILAVWIFTHMVVEAMINAKVATNLMYVCVSRCQVHAFPVVRGLCCKDHHLCHSLGSYLL